MIRLALRVRRDDAEIALAQLLELAPSGVEEREVDDDHVELAIYGTSGELPELPDLRAVVGERVVAVSSRALPDDWGERWKQFHQPVEIGGRLRVRAPWHAPGGAGSEQPAGPAGVAGSGSVLLDVVIDPGQAFGTGAHATTRLVLELLCERAPGAGAALDLGCGSGVLAIAAAKLGWGPVVALDREAASVAATRANAAANGVAIVAHERDGLSASSVREQLPAGGLVLANLLRPLLLALAARLVEQERRPRWLLAGGLLSEEADELAAAFAPAGLVERRRLERDGWAALELEAPTAPDIL